MTTEQQAAIERLSAENAALQLQIERIRQILPQVEEALEECWGQVSTDTHCNTSKKGWDALQALRALPQGAGQPQHLPVQAEQQEQSVHQAGGKLDGAVACQSHGSVPDGALAKLACEAKEAIFGLSNVLHHATNNHAWCIEAKQPHMDKAFRAIDALVRQRAELPFAILPDEMEALERFHECVMDSQDYDVPKDMMRRLSEIGLLRHVNAGRYEHTNFGLAILNGEFTTGPMLQARQDDSACQRPNEQNAVCAPAQPTDNTAEGESK